MTKTFIIVMLIGLFMSVANAANESQYIEMLEQAAKQANLVITNQGRHCVERILPAIPQSVKSKAIELHTIEINALRNAGVPEVDLNKASLLAHPCINQISIDTANASRK